MIENKYSTYYDIENDPNSISPKELRDMFGKYYKEMLKRVNIYPLIDDRHYNRQQVEDYKRELEYRKTIASIPSHKKIREDISEELKAQCYTMPELIKMFDVSHQTTLKILNEINAPKYYDKRKKTHVPKQFIDDYIKRNGNERRK